MLGHRTLERRERAIEIAPRRREEPPTPPGCCESGRAVEPPGAPLESIEERLGLRKTIETDECLDLVGDERDRTRFTDAAGLEAIAERSENLVRLLRAVEGQFQQPTAVEPMIRASIAP